MADGQPSSAKRPRTGAVPKGSAFLEVAAREAAIAPIAGPVKGPLMPRGQPLELELLTFLTQVRRGVEKSITPEELQRVRNKEANLEIEARLGLINHR